MLYLSYPHALRGGALRTPIRYRFVQSRIAHRQLSTPPRPSRRPVSCSSSGGDVEHGSYTYNQIALNIEKLDLNQLQTALTTAIAAEDYALAGKLRDRISALIGDGSARIDWAAADLPDWLVERAENLGFRFPTEVQRRAAPVICSGCDAVIRSQTGSGKTLAFLVPLLGRLQYPPAVFPDDLAGPQALIVVPTMELGVQVAMLVYRMLGGSVGSGVPGDKGNMFNYSGPRGIKVRGLLTKEEVVMAKAAGYLQGCHVVVGTPAAIMEVVHEQPQALPLLDHLRVLAIDEVDACLAQEREAMQLLLGMAVTGHRRRALSASDDPQQQVLADAGAAGAGQAAAAAAAGGGLSSCSGDAGRVQVVYVGATVQQQHVDEAVQQGWLREPVHISIGHDNQMPAGLQHRLLVCAKEERLRQLVRLLRQDLQSGSADAAPARAMVFANSEEEAVAAADPLRTALWQQYQLSVLLPTGQEPIKALHAFRDNQTTLLVCTAQASRGLDLPAVSHVYNLDPPSSAAEYLHRAGRAGRIGSTTGGIVTTVVDQDQLQQLREIQAQLGLEMAELPADGVVGELQQEDDVEKLRKGLEDIFTLY